MLRRTLQFAVLLLLAWCMPADAQEPGVNVSLGQASGPADAQAVVPLSMSGSGDPKLASVTVRVPFPTALLTFVKVDPSGLAVGVDAKITTDVKPGSGADTSVLHATIASSDAGGQRRALPLGVLAYITFRIAKDAKPETTVPLAAEASVASIAEPSKQITVAKVAPGEVTVAAPPVPVCFFYMH